MVEIMSKKTSFEDKFFSIRLKIFNYYDRSSHVKIDFFSSIYTLDQGWAIYLGSRPDMCKIDGFMYI